MTPPTPAPARRARPRRARAARATAARAVPAVLVTALLVLAAGCSDPAPAAAPTPSSSASAAPADPATISVAPVAVTLSDAGQEPRRALALDLGPSQQVTLTTTAGIVQTVGTQDAVDLSSPPVSVPLTATPAAVPADAGAARPVDLQLGTPTSPDAILTQALAAEAGSSAGLAVRTSAAVDQLSLTPAPAALDTARSAVEQALRQAVQLGVALPTAEVGVGARWTVSQQLDSLGLALRQDVTVTLLEVSGTTVRLGVALAQTPLSNTWTLPDSGGTTFSVDSYPMQGTGELTLDLRRPLPTAGSLELRGKQVYTRSTDRLQLSQDVTNRVAWAS